MKLSRNALRFSLLLLAWSLPRLAAAEDATLAQKAQAVLRANCYRCHGRDGAVEGGMNYRHSRQVAALQEARQQPDAAAR
jgi:mono/diheme cytochrome c family protein